MVARGCSESRSARMRKPGGSTLAALLVLGSALFSAPAWAFLDPPYITPANPIAGDLVFVNIYGGGCDVAEDGVVWPPPTSRHGSEITILLTGIHEGDPEWCIYGTGTATIPVGKFPPGSYKLDVERRYFDPFGSWTQETLGIVPFVVAGAPPAQPFPIPTLCVSGTIGLILTLISAALCGMRRRKHQLH